MTSNGRSIFLYLVPPIRRPHIAPLPRSLRRWPTLHPRPAPLLYLTLCLRPLVLCLRLAPRLLHEDIAAAPPPDTRCRLGRSASRRPTPPRPLHLCLGRSASRRLTPPRPLHLHLRPLCLLAPDAAPVAPPLPPTAPPPGRLTPVFWVAMGSTRQVAEDGKAEHGAWGPSAWWSGGGDSSFAPELFSPRASVWVSAKAAPFLWSDGRSTREWALVWSTGWIHIDKLQCHFLGAILSNRHPIEDSLSPLLRQRQLRWKGDWRYTSEVNFSHNNVKGHVN
jgi:hypothetical protein